MGKRNLDVKPSTIMLDSNFRDIHPRETEVAQFGTETGRLQRPEDERPREVSRYDAGSRQCGVHSAAKEKNIECSYQPERPQTPCMPREVPVPELRVHPQHSSVSTVVVHFIHDRLAARDTWYPTAAGFAPHARQSVYVLVLVSGPGRTLSSSDAASGIRDAGRSKTRRSGFYYSMWKMKVTWSCTSYNPLLAPFDLSPCLRVLQHAIVGHQPFDLRISFEFSARLNLEDNLCLLLRTIT
ncbi:hypothetical protein AXG93_412s1160 [Marchantia polymorpha subsp. ruderalis]|uniref:Uncharacterized protein n=1 Tax=Marchantia polymorpha subsp. ruderalis TaxID=1480154 RepID=A0A176VNK1_MARPO|nr:hypothetical protein AXG93_412s1160 [Marchantia polymorpha subsp. ruderalis]